MTLKEKIKKRISIKENANKVLRSTLKLTDGIKKIDKESMGALLSYSKFEKRVERDLELYVLGEKVLVLDNELPIYNTDVADVVVRKSPILKEMVKIRNIIKILWDSNVVISKGKKSVEYIRDECLSGIVISGTEEELNDIKYEAIVSLESSDFDEIINTLKFYSELLGYEKLTKPYFAKESTIFGEKDDDSAGPFIIYNSIKNEIWFYDEKIEKINKEKVKELQLIASGLKRSVCNGRDVFEELNKLSVKKI
ncbi:MAG: hypothetical protein GY760_21395 [Deltaproteobacteria bacterium]|nr:hypothetical protein [Deltaproteobacteria bacterium]